MYTKMKAMEEQWGKLQLTEEEEANIEITEEEVASMRKEGDLCLIEKLRVDRVINKGVIKTVIDKIWRLSSKLVFKEVKANVFTVLFANLADKSRVENRKPWLFSNNIFVLEQFDGLIPIVLNSIMVLASTDKILDSCH